MGDLTISIEPEKVLGLAAIVELEKAVNGREANVAGTAKTLIDKALATKLEELGLPWAPSPEAVRKRAAESAEPGGALRRLMRSKRARKYAVAALAVAVLIVLWGGYIRGWEWTGFQANQQLWDWLKLLLLPVVVGTIPLWIEHPDYISRDRRMMYLILTGALAAFIAAGYLVPLNWTGFPGNTLWNWFEVVLLPAAVVSARLLPSALRSLPSYHKGVIALMAVGWVVTIIGGYGLQWTWTGYEGNTLWDWLQLLLLPLLVPAVLVPTALAWVSANQPAAAREAPGRPRHVTAPAHGPHPPPR